MYDFKWNCDPKHQIFLKTWQMTLSWNISGPAKWQMTYQQKGHFNYQGQSRSCATPNVFSSGNDFPMQPIKALKFDLSSNHPYAETQHKESQSKYWGTNQCRCVSKIISSLPQGLRPLLSIPSLSSRVLEALSIRSNGKQPAKDRLSLPGLQPSWTFYILVTKPW